MNTQRGALRKGGQICGLLLSLCCLCVLLSGCSKRYVVTFDMNGGSLVEGELIQMVNEGESAVGPTVENGNQILSWDRDFSYITDDTVVTAQWAPGAYTVRFDLNGGELISGETEQVVEAGAAAVAPEAVNGILQLSWDTDFSCISSDTVVTAHWEKVKLDTADLAEYVQERAVTVNVKLLNGGESAGSGFFIDDEGTLVTNWHVIEIAKEISVMVSDGGKYDVARVVDFSELYDLAILKIDVSNSPYLELCEDTVRSGEKVYAVGSALGTLTGSFTSGIISSTERKIGNVEYLQMDAAISSGNSGGPLVNEYGEVVGVNTLSYVNGENLNMAIKIETLAKLKRDKNWTVQEFSEWYIKESDRSYSPWDGDDGYYYSTIHTYQTVTGRECAYSVAGDDANEGYVDCCEFYVYEYDEGECDRYVEYLKEIGFAFDGRESGTATVFYYYYSERDNVMVVLSVATDNSAVAVTVYQG